VVQPPIVLKTYKLYIHTIQFCTEDIVIRSEDFPEVDPGDILEIYHEEETFSRLLLQVRPESLYPDNNLQKTVPKDTVYIEKSIAESFQLSNYKSLVVNKVDKMKVALDSVELLFKEQYLGRSEMWRLKKFLADSVVFLNKKISFCKDTIRCTVNEMWGQGDRVACGAITPDTKVVFRSTTAMVYLFIQMSSEMWDFDMYGDLYFEKAVNGFLYEMFSKWQKTGASHETTIVLFSRTFYEARELSEFPPHMHECLQQDYRGRFYEDFYRVVVQNEKFDDWFPTLTLLRQTFTDYCKLVVNYHHRPGIKIPPATNSTAAQGNFLEVLNISLNTFEKHFINRNLDRTGQQAIVITPGVGIFEVDRDLTVITKQRIIDSGVGSDLICVGEQPLHAVPLFKMHARGSDPSRQEDYSMPHWMNLSFYTTDRKIGYSSFIPRIKLPPLVCPTIEDARVLTCYFPPDVQESQLPDSPFAHDEYDANVFVLPVSKNRNNSNMSKKSITGSSSNISSPSKGGKSNWRSESAHSRYSEKEREGRRKGEEGILKRSESQSRLATARSIAIMIPSNSGKQEKKEEIYSKSFGGEFKRQEANKVGLRLDLSSEKNSLEEDTMDTISTSLKDNNKPIFGSAGAGSQFDHSNIKNYLLRPGRALVNPFDPSHVTVKLTSNRRRWTHIFPKGPTGHHQQVHVQQVHHDGGGESRASPTGAKSSPVGSACSGQVAATPAKAISEATLKRISDIAVTSVGVKRQALPVSGKERNRSLSNCELRQLGTFMWGATGEQPWDATLTTGVDWKSITWPACLPITTDYFPDKRAFDNDYVVNQYVLVPDELNGDYVVRSPLQKQPLSTKEVFLELISQRLSQGFQLIISPKEDPADPASTPLSAISNPMSTSFSGSSIPKPRGSLVQYQNSTKTSESFWLSIGRNFHHLSLTGNTIDIIIYRPRHPYPTLDYHYSYRFMAPDNDTYEVSWVEFNMEKLENYSWNYLDHYVSTRGDQEDFTLAENLKHWRFRIYVLPLKPFIPFTNQIKDSPSDSRCRCDIYKKPTTEENVNLAEGFLRFVETCLNKIKRPNSVSTDIYRRKSRCATMAVGDLKPPGSMRGSMFRERVGSSSHTRPVVDRARDRVVSGPVTTHTERKRTESGSGVKGMEPLRPLTQTITTLDMGGAGSQDSVFGVSGGSTASVSSLDSQENKDFKLLRSSCTMQEILEAMRNPSTGLAFVSKTSPLPSTTFVSAEAVMWLMEHVEGVCNEKRGIVMMEQLLEQNYIRHASGDTRVRFRYGFYLYCLVEKDMGALSYQGDSHAFSNDWIEVALEFYRPDREELEVFQCCAEDSGFGLDFLQQSIRRFSGNSGDFNKPSTYQQGQLKDYAFKSFTLDVDSVGKSERPEWGEGKYQGKYRPDKAFELRVNWSVATGAVITELVSNWARKAQNNGLSIIPIPGDPFALPSQNSDPIRGPIFIELDTTCLMQEKVNLFQEFSEESWEQRLFLFRESIVKRFGFIACTTDPHQQKSSATFSTHHQYIHCTGNCFVLIPTQLELVPGIQGIKGMSSKKKSVGSNVLMKTTAESTNVVTGAKSATTLNSSVISRHPAGKTQVRYEHDETGFLWSWNFMISKRWKNISNTGATGEIPFMDKLLADFRRFCNNEDNRLVNYWDECWEQIHSHRQR